MAKRLVEDMSADWQPDEYRDSFQDKIMALVAKKAKAGKIEDVESQEGSEERNRRMSLTSPNCSSAAGRQARRQARDEKAAAKKSAKKGLLSPHLLENDMAKPLSEYNRKRDFGSPPSPPAVRPRANAKPRRCRS